MFGWFKRKEYIAPPSGLMMPYELIYTTIKGRMDLYYEWGLGRTAVGEITDKIYKQWNELPLHMRMHTNDLLISTLEQFILLEEDNYKRKMEVLKKEYGM